MSKKNRKHREHWYSGITEAFQSFIPGNKTYHTIAARRARTGFLFILPFIIGFIFFMVKPLVVSLQISFSKYIISTGEMTWNGVYNYNYALYTDPDYNRMLVDEVSRMAVNVIATLVMSFVIAVILNQKFKGRIICRVIFFLPVILSSGVLPGIETSSTSLNMINSMSEAMGESSGVDISAALQDLLQVSGVGSGVFDVIFQMINSI